MSCGASTCLENKDKTYTSKLNKYYQFMGSQKGLWAQGGLLGGGGFAFMEK